MLDVMEVLLPIIWIFSTNSGLAYAANDIDNIGDGFRGGGGGGGHGSGGGHSSGGGSGSGSGGGFSSGNIYHGSTTSSSSHKCYNLIGNRISCPKTKAGKLATIIICSIIGGILVIILLWYLWRRVLGVKLRYKVVGRSRGLPDAENANSYSPDVTDGTAWIERRSTDSDPSLKAEQKKPLKG